MEGKKTKHAGIFDGMCFRSWNWMHFTHNGIKLTILARHQNGSTRMSQLLSRNNGCWCEMTQGQYSRHNVRGELEGWGETSNTGLRYTKGLHAIWTQLGSDTMGRDFKAMHHFGFLALFHILAAVFLCLRQLPKLPWFLNSSVLLTKLCVLLNLGQGLPLESKYIHLSEVLADAF